VSFQACWDLARVATGSTAVTIEELLVIGELRNLRQAYSAYYDTQDIDNLMGLYTEDAVCEFGKDTAHGRW
jgi:hypothetical protein